MHVKNQIAKENAIWYPINREYFLYKCDLIFIEVQQKYLKQCSIN